MNDRGTGITTRQMQAAPLGAVFIWCNSALDYPRALARRTGRADLEVVAPYWLDGDRWRGRNLTGIVLDHAAELSSRRFDMLSIIRSRILEVKQ